MIRSGIYVIETNHVGGSGKCIKIGMSKDIPTRLRNYTTAMGSNYIVYYYYLVPEPIEQVFRVEKLLHEHFNIFHINDEAAKELFDIDAIHEDMPLISFPESSECFRPIPINLPLTTALNIFDPILPNLDGGASIDYWKTTKSDTFYNTSLLPPTRSFDKFINKFCDENVKTIKSAVKDLSDIIGYDINQTTIYIKEANKRRGIVIYKQYPFTSYIKTLNKHKLTVRKTKKEKEVITVTTVSKIIRNFQDVFGYIINPTHIPPNKNNILTLKPWRIQPAQMKYYANPQITINIIKNKILSNSSSATNVVWFNQFIYWIKSVVFTNRPLKRSVILYGISEQKGKDSIFQIFNGLLGEQNIRLSSAKKQSAIAVSDDYKKIPNNYGYAFRVVIIFIKTADEFAAYRDDQTFIISDNTAVIFIVKTNIDEPVKSIGGKEVIEFIGSDDKITNFEKKKIYDERTNFSRFILLKSNQIRDNLGTHDTISSIYETTTAMCNSIISEI